MATRSSPSPTSWHPGVRHRRRQPRLAPAEPQAASPRNTPASSPYDVIDLDGLRQTLWPDHCVQGARGAKLHGDLDSRAIRRVFRKGQDPRVDSYSAFFDNARRRSTGLSEWLRAERIDELHIMGLATDYCVRFSALDSAEQGFRTHLILEGCRGIDLELGDVDRAVEEMRQAGVTVD